MEAYKGHTEVYKVTQSYIRSHRVIQGHMEAYKGHIELYRVTETYIESHRMI